MRSLFTHLTLELLKAKVMVTKVSKNCKMDHAACANLDLMPDFRSSRWSMGEENADQKI